MFRRHCQSIGSQTLSLFLRTGEAIMPYIQKGQLVVLESKHLSARRDTELARVLERSGLKRTRILPHPIRRNVKDPGNETFSTSTIQKLSAPIRGSYKNGCNTIWGVISEVVPVASSHSWKPSS